jgi:NADH-quinone oxidoreductase subunit N
MPLLFQTPEFLLLAWAVFLLLLEAFLPGLSPAKVAKLAMLGTAGVLLSTWCFQIEMVPQWGGLYQTDNTALFFKRFFLVTLLAVTGMSHEYGNKLPLGRAEFMVLPLFTTVGMLLLASAADLMTVFVALELVTISFYLLVAYQRNLAASLEAGAKYLIIGALSTGFLVYGIAFVFGSTGSTSLLEIGVSAKIEGITFALLLGMALILVGAAFKVAAVPFHMWAPDVYQGAPTPITAFLAVGSKAAGFVLLLRVLFLNGFGIGELQSYIGASLAFLGAASVLLGNLAALPQQNLKRLMGYSSISHAGYMLLALSCVGVTERAVQAVFLYLVIYLLSTLLVFFALSWLGGRLGGYDLSHYAGLSQRCPLMAFGLTVGMASLAGIPPLAGFLGKLGILAALWEQGSYTLLGLALFGAAASLFYYFAPLKVMYWQAPPRTGEPLPLSGCVAWTVLVLSGALLVLGIWQAPLMQTVSWVLQK